MVELEEHGCPRFAGWYMQRRKEDKIEGVRISLL